MLLAKYGGFYFLLENIELYRKYSKYDYITLGIHVVHIFVGDKTIRIFRNVEIVSKFYKISTVLENIALAFCTQIAGGGSKKWGV